MRQLLLITFLLLCLPTAFAATCGDNNAQGSEQCDGADLRGYSCTNVCFMNPGSPADYSYDASRYDGADRFYCYDAGTLACAANCKVVDAGCYQNICGNAIASGAEECDDGAENSDTARDACRTDCTLPRCGDNVVDAGERCDDGSRNSDEIPDACRTDCSLASCGDGVIDVDEGEECDDEYGQCFKCRRCIEPRDNLVITADTKLCSGTYQLADEGAEGVIIVSGSGVTVDCRDVYLYGVPTNIAQYVQGAAGGVAAQAAMQAGAPDAGSQDDPSDKSVTRVAAKSGLFSHMFSFIRNIFGGEPADRTPSTPANYPGQTLSEMKRGVGILVSGDENVLINCDISNYRYGIKVTGTENILGRNRACGNNHDMTGDGVGGANACSSGGWHDAGFAGCAQKCDGQNGSPADNPCQQQPVQPDEEPVEVPEPAPLPEENFSDDEPVDCPDGSTAVTLAECPTACSANEYACDDGRCVSAEWRCDPFRCWDGSLVPDEEECPCRSTEFRCDTGECVKKEWMCDPYTCDDGSEVEKESDCHGYCGDYECDDGRCVDEEWRCDPYTCDDGSLVASEEDCPEYCADHTCADGSCVASADECMVCCKTRAPIMTALIYNYDEMTAGACTQTSGITVPMEQCA